ncbi:HdeD family acid-resistance protein [Chitinophaga sp. sic0106]|uniref:HdeD family acid-resistance protein n=1 Tax=Chitinophaga sp. sic0106 TaxID=2854785 RepID=UPI001C47D575|nr:HdeD family acid-resistance protein [Chitinophaga sp. sic0106]MBV7530551.1 HdeD family acid-resistance protein [Chitinophaga sp. sic0106]
MSNLFNAIRSNVKYWWLYLLNGIIFIIAGFVVFSNPFSSYVLLSIFFAVTLFVSGFAEIIFAVSNREHMYGWGWSLASGIIDLVVGLLLMIYPAVSMAVIPIFLGFWFLFRGISLIVFSIQLSMEKVPNWGWLLVGGIILIMLSVFILDNPALGVATILGIVAASFWVAGVLAIIFAFRLRHVKKEFKKLV